MVQGKEEWGGREEKGKEARSRDLSTKEIIIMAWEPEEESMAVSAAQRREK